MRLKTRKETESGVRKYEPFLVPSVNYPYVALLTLLYPMSLVRHHILAPCDFLRFVSNVLISCRGMLFCALTNQLIKKNIASVEEHLKGKRFKGAQGRNIFICPLEEFSLLSLCCSVQNIRCHHPS